MLVCTVFYMFESLMSIGGLVAAIRIEFIRLTLEYTLGHFPFSHLPAAAATFLTSFLLVLEWWFTCW